MTATESEICVDELLARQVKIDQLVSKFDTGPYDVVVSEARETVSTTQSFIDNNKSLIPSYCLKKVTDALRKLEMRINDPQKTKLMFKFKPSQKANLKTTTGECQAIATDVMNTNKEREASPPQSFGFHDRANENLSLGPDGADSKDLTLVNLRGCFVTITGNAATLHMRDLTDTTVVVCLACRSIQVKNCTNCQFKLVCQQLRIDSTTNSKFEIFTSAGSMLESSNQLEFKCLDINSIEGARELLERAGFKQNNWKHIDDFDWLSNTPSNNFRLVHHV